MEFATQVFLQALELWLVEDGAHWRKGQRRYPLAHFVTSGKFEYYVSRIVELSRNAEGEAQRQVEAEMVKKRQVIKGDLMREEDVVGREFSEWQSTHGTPDGFCPSNPAAFERYSTRERLQQWKPGSEESWAQLDAQRLAGLKAAIEARLGAAA